MTEREYIEKRIDEGALCIWCESPLKPSDETIPVFSYQIHKSPCGEAFKVFTTDEGEAVVEMRRAIA